MGYEVHVATNGTAEIPHCDVRHTVSFARSPFKPDNLRAIGQLRKIIDHEQFDLIHTHTPMGSVVTRLAAKEARKRGTRVIYTAHGFHFYKGAPWHYWALFYPIEKFLARYTDVLITINHEDYDLAKRKFKTRVEYVPGVGIDPKKFDFPFTEADKLKLRKSLGLKKDDFVMIFPAELNKNKNQILLINAMDELVEKHPDIHLLLPGKDSLNGKYQKIVRERCLDANIHFLGYRTDIPKLLKISDLAVSSSLREGLPVNIIEAMKVGLPIVTTNCRGAQSLVSKQGGYVISKGQEKLFIKTIIKLYEQSELRLSMIKINTEAAGQYLLEPIVSKVGGEIYV
jgi:glycosyltransferase EpsD